jgi:hypothetical protein
MKRLALLLALLLSLPLFAAEKRRSVGAPDLNSDNSVVTVTGTVTDAGTGLGIPFATITIGKRHVFASRLGTFSVSVKAALGDVDVTAGRTGYQSSTVTISGTGTHEMDFQLQGRPTAVLQKTDGTVVTLDDDSVTFGYVVPFMNYQTRTGNLFCMTDGTHATVPVAQIARITAMGTSVPSSCCQRPAQRVLLELRDGTLHDATFIDSCYGYSVDLIARDRVTGDTLYVPFGDVSEIVFP